MHNFVTDRSASFPLETMDLTGGEVEITYMLSPDFDTKGSHILFWFQMYSGTRQDGPYVNYALKVYPLENCPKGEWITAVLPLNSNDADWACMGSSMERQGFYTCLPIDQALKSVNGNFGIIAIPIPDGNDPPMGTFRISEFKITYRTILK